MFQKTIDSCQCFSTHLRTCVVAIDLESNRRFWIKLFTGILVVSLSGTIFGFDILYMQWLRKVFCSLELRVQFCLLVCCTYPSLSTVNKEKNRTDQRASLRVDTRETTVSQGRSCSDKLTCYHTEIEVGQQAFYPTQSQCTGTGPTSPSADPITYDPGAWQGSHWSANFKVTGMTRPGKMPTAQAGFEPRISRYQGGRLNH